MCNSNGVIYSSKEEDIHNNILTYKEQINILNLCHCCSRGWMDFFHSPCDQWGSIEDGRCTILSNSVISSRQNLKEKTQTTNSQMRLRMIRELLVCSRILWETASSKSRRPQIVRNVGEVKENKYGKIDRRAGNAGLYDEYQMTQWFTI